MRFQAQLDFRTDLLNDDVLTATADFLVSGDQRFENRIMRFIVGLVCRRMQDRVCLCESAQGWALLDFCPKFEEKLTKQRKICKRCVTDQKY